MKLSLPILAALGVVGYLVFKGGGSDADVCNDVKLVSSDPNQVTLSFLFASGPALTVKLKRAPGTTTSDAQDAAAVLAIKAGATGKTRAQIVAQVQAMPAFASVS